MQYHKRADARASSQTLPALVAASHVSPATDSERACPLLLLRALWQTWPGQVERADGARAGAWARIVGWTVCPEHSSEHLAGRVGQINIAGTFGWKI